MWIPAFAGMTMIGNGVVLFLDSNFSILKQEFNMSFSSIPLMMALSEFAPFIARWMGGEKSEKVAQQLVESAQKITGETEPLKVLESLKSDPKFVPACGSKNGP